MKTILMGLLLMISMLSAQAVELSSACFDDCETTESHTETKAHHCHHTCVQCHTVFASSPTKSFSLISYSVEITFPLVESSTEEFQTSFDRPPILFS